MRRLRPGIFLETVILTVLLCFLAYAFIGCASSSSVPTPAVPKYELTLSGSLDGVPFQGVAMASAAAEHELTISSKYDVNYFIAQTCHRWDKKEDVIEQGWFPSTKSWTYEYEASPTIEDTGDCPMRICVYSKTVGAPPVECAVIDSRNERYEFPLENICNGLDAKNQGKSICHTKTGLVERIRFAEPVVVADPLPTPEGGDPKGTYLIPSQCDGDFIDSSNKIWEYVMPKDECYVIFAQLAKPHARAKLTAVPFDLPLYSGGK